MKFICSFAIICVITTTGHAQTTYTRLNPLAGDTTCEALAVSDNGTVVGTSGNRAVRWVGGIPVALGDLPGGSTVSAARAISADGTMIVGNAGSANGTEAFLWTAGTGMVALGDLNGGGFLSTARAITPDGVWICGNGLVNAGTQAARYGPGLVWEGLGELSGGSYYSQANAIGSDGAVCVGYSRDAEGEQAFRWTTSLGMIPLPGLPQGPLSEARAISSDGTIAFGYAGNGGSEPDGKPVRWDGMGQPQILTIDPVNGQANSCSAMGGVAGGYHEELRAFLWTKSLGLVNLQTYLDDLLVSGVTSSLDNVKAVSPSGNFLAGRGRSMGSPVAWVAHLSLELRAFPRTVIAVDGFLPNTYLARPLQYVDGSVLSIYSGEETQNTILEVTSCLPVTPSALDVQARLMTTRTGLSLALETFDYTEHRFEQVYGAVAGTSMQDIDVQVVAPESYLNDQFETRLRVIWRPINDEDPAQDSWLSQVDVLRWVVTP